MRNLTFSKFIIGCAVMILLLGAVSLFSGCTKNQAHVIASWSNDLKQEYVIQDVDNRLYNYQWFYDQYNACVATANNVKILDGEERKGTLMVLNNMISEYNSKSSQTINAALWKAKDLPYQLSLSDFGLSNR
jgi:hypothetical protein